MVFGIGEGKIEIQADKMPYSRGETITGKVILEVNAPKKAKGVVVKFYAQMQEKMLAVRSGASAGTGISITGGVGGMRRGRMRAESTKTVVLYKQEAKLDGEKMYSGRSEYPFEFKVPSADAQAVNAQNQMAKMMNAAITGRISTESPLEWYIDASLDVPMSLDINKKMRVNIV